MNQNDHPVPDWFPDVPDAAPVVLDALGIGAVAKDLGLPDTQVAIAAAMVASAVAGPGLHVRASWGRQRPAGVNLALEAGSSAYSDLTDCLLGTIEELQRKHLRNASSYNRELMDVAVRGPTGKALGKRGFEAPQAAAESEVVSVFEQGNPGLHDDLKGYRRVTQREALQNPKVLLRAAGAERNLKGKIAQCHEHFALVEMIPSSKQGDKIPVLVRDMLALDRGSQVPTGSDRDLDCHATARFLIALHPADREKAARLKLYRRFLFLRDDVPEADPVPHRAIMPFTECFERGVEKVWEQRRRDEPYSLEFDYECNAQAFSGQLRKFQDDCHALGALGEAARGLPAALMLLFQLLSEQADSDIKEYMLVSACFEISDAALREHQAVVSKLLRPDMDKRISALALEMLEGLGYGLKKTEKGERQYISNITSRMSKPKRAEAQITMEIMVKLSVVIFHENETYQLGNVRLEDVRDELLRLVGAKLIAEM